MRTNASELKTWDQLNQAGSDMGTHLQLNSEVPAIEQLDELYWLPFYAAPRHSYNLSGIYLSFTGNPSPNLYAEPDFIGYETDIHSESSCPKKYGNMELWNESSSYIQAEVLDLSVGCGYEIDDETVGDMGVCHFEIRLLKQRKVEWEEHYDFREPAQIKKQILRRYRDIKDDFSSIEDYFIPLSEDGLEEKVVKGRSWYLGVSGVESAYWSFSLYTALTPEHLLFVVYKLRFWPSDHRPSEKALQVSLAPLWDFMDNLEIDEAPGNIEVGVRDATNSLVREEKVEDDLDTGW